MLIRLKYFARTVTVVILLILLVVMAGSALIGDELSLRERSDEVYERLNEPIQPLVVDINTASVRELQKLNGIGEMKANAIVAYREENGAFNSADDLLNVKGIGSATLEKIRPQISLTKGDQRICH